jgi:ribosomal protein S30
MPHDQEDDLEMQMYVALGTHKRKHGKATHEALLKNFGVSVASDIPPDDFKKVIAACSTADKTPRQSARATNDEAPRTRNRLRFQGLGREARKLSDFETIINSQEDIKAGFSMAAKAIHAKRPK